MSVTTDAGMTGSFWTEPQPFCLLVTVLLLRSCVNDGLVLVMTLVEKFGAHCLSGRWLITWTKTGHLGLEDGMFNDAEWQATPIGTQQSGHPGHLW